MAHFYGKIRGNRGEATRCGTKNSGLVAEVLSWTGGVNVELYFNEKKNDNWVKVWLVIHNGQGVNKELYHGPVSGYEVPEEMVDDYCDDDDNAWSFLEEE